LTYVPAPIDTAQVSLTPGILKLTELLAHHAHEVWASQRLKDGWQYGPKRNDATREHPCLVPYDQLPDSEKQYDRNAALETLKAITALGYRVEKPARHKRTTNSKRKA
jgi:ryanodine receptor 2